MRTRSIGWIEGKIIEVLNKKRVVTTHLALTSLVLRNVRSLGEQHNFDTALVLLLSKKEITQSKDPDGCTVFRCAAYRRIPIRQIISQPKKE